MRKKTSKKISLNSRIMLFLAYKGKYEETSQLGACQYDKTTKKSMGQSFKIFNEDLVAVNMKKTNIVLNRHIYAGFCILYQFKIYTYQFNYDVTKPSYFLQTQTP